MGNTVSITTRNGDGGLTRLYSGEEVAKDAPEMEACGDLDELGTLLGVARLHAGQPETREALLPIQRALFVVTAETATTREHVDRLAARVDRAMVESLSASDNKRNPLLSTVSMISVEGIFITSPRVMANTVKRPTTGIARSRNADCLCSSIFSMASMTRNSSSAALIRPASMCAFACW